jgi:glycosyltransferase involved in cell wall biosynthesis
VTVESIANKQASTDRPETRIEPQERRHTIALLLPTLNEVQGLKAIVPQIDRSLVDDIIVIDGRSTDGTVEYAMAVGLTIVSQIRPGLQHAIFDVARTLPHDYIIEFSPDGNCKVDQLPELVAKIGEGHDHVIVSRYLRHAVSEDDDVVTAFGNWMFSRLMRPLASFEITDALNIYRGYRRNILLDPDFEFYMRGPVLEPLITGMCALRGRSAAEIPGDEPVRIGGVTKRSILYNGSMILLMIVRLYLRKFLGLRL